MIKNMVKSVLAVMLAVGGCNTKKLQQLSR